MRIPVPLAFALLVECILPIAVRAESIRIVPVSPTITLERVSDHGDYVICRFVAATSPFAELVAIEIRGRHRLSSERLRYLLTRFAIPPAISQIEEAIADISESFALIEATSTDWLGAP